MTAPLDQLHDFSQPVPPSWAPQTIGWYVLFALVAVLLLWLAVHLVRRHVANRYRREALRELALLPPERLSELLKRTSLSAWPRHSIASLSGASWLRFLNASTAQPLFDHPPANRIEELALQPQTLPASEEQALRQTVAHWIRRHRVQT